MKLSVAVAAAAFAGVAAAQPATTSVGRAASAAVTPGDQDMGRNPNNRSGGLMGNDRTGTGSAATSVGRAASAAVTPGDQDMGRNPNNRSGGLMGNDRTGRGSATGNGRRAARADRG
ncbi:MAG: hypothetical protein M3Z29_14110 [Pseudomonadota bacterium]|nr:hypothetical protein [Pseudomonadota bacterium]